jgi:YD repeat-containing protein
MYMTPVGYYTFTKYTSSLAESQGIGLPFYHQRVLEETISNTDTIRTAYHFQNFSSYLGVELQKKEEFVKKNGVYSVQSQSETFFGPEIFDFQFPLVKIFVHTEHIPDLYSEYGYEVRTSKHMGKWKYSPLAIQTKYENGQAQVTENKSYYDVTGTRNLIATKQTVSDGTTYYTRYKYPEDYSIFSTLVNANMLSPIEEQVWRKNPAGDSSMVSGKITEYNGLRVAAIYVLESLTGISALNSETKSANKYTSLLSDTRYKKKIEFKYNAAGRVTSQQLTDDVMTSYLWGYQPSAYSTSPVLAGVYPIAEIRNAEADSVFYTSFEDATGTDMSCVTGTKAKSGSFTITGSFTGSYKLSYWKKIGTGAWALYEQTITNPSNVVIGAAGSYLDEVRLHPVKALMTTYTYRCGVGISTLNDPNNTVTYYQYDYANRLEAIKDKSGNILKTYQYHVKDEKSISAQ